MTDLQTDISQIPAFPAKQNVPWPIWCTCRTSDNVDYTKPFEIQYLGKYNTVLRKKTNLYLNDTVW